MNNACPPSGRSPNRRSRNLSVAPPAVTALASLSAASAAPDSATDAVQAARPASTASVRDSGPSHGAAPADGIAVHPQRAIQAATETLERRDVPTWTGAVIVPRRSAPPPTTDRSIGAATGDDENGGGNAGDMTRRPTAESDRDGKHVHASTVHDGTREARGRRRKNSGPRRRTSRGVRGPRSGVTQSGTSVDRRARPPGRPPAPVRAGHPRIRNMSRVQNPGRVALHWAPCSHAEVPRSETQAGEHAERPGPAPCDRPSHSMLTPRRADRTPQVPR